MSPVAITPGRLIAGVLGGLFAMLAAAATFGLAAALFDIQQNLRRLVEATWNDRPEGAEDTRTVRVQPSFPNRT